MCTSTYFFLILCLPAVFCEGQVKQLNDTNNRIIGGYPTYVEYFKWQAALFDNNGFHTCGGAIISAYWVITAAHCFNGRAAQNVLNSWTVRAGSSYKNQVNQSRGIYYYVTHQNYKSTSFDWDVALIYVKAPFVWTSTVYPILLTNYEPAAGTVLSVSGWGLTSSTDTTGSNQLKYTNMYVLNRLNCAKASSDFTDRTLCVEGSGTGTCPGDSGGPGIIWDASRNSYVLAGLVGFGPRDTNNKCSVIGSPNGFTNVYYMRSWIKYYTGF